MGVILVNADGKAAFDSPQGKAAFQYWVDLYKKGLLPQEVLTQGHQHAIDLYQSGETALLASGPEFLKTIANNAPQELKLLMSPPKSLERLERKCGCDEFSHSQGVKISRSCCQICFVCHQ